MLGNGTLAPGADGQMIQLMITLPSALIIGFAVLMMIYRMIDGQMPAAPGVTVIGLLFVVLYFCVWPPHPAVPAIGLVAVICGMVGFPFAESYLEKMLLEEIDVDQLERSLKSWQARPDNIASQLQLAASLYKQGFRHHAIALASDGLSRASTVVDDVRNTSMRDVFRQEEYALRKWQQEDTPAPKEVNCPSCGHRNPHTTVFCQKCQQPFILALARNTNVGVAVFGRLAITMAMICAAIVAGCAVGLYFDGPLKWLAFTVMIVIIGAAIAFILRTRNVVSGAYKIVGNGRGLSAMD